MLILPTFWTPSLKKHNVTLHVRFTSKNCWDRQPQSIMKEQQNPIIKRGFFNEFRKTETKESLWPITTDDTNNTMNKSELEASSAEKRVRLSHTRTVSPSLLIGWESSTSNFNQSQSAAKENQGKVEITFDSWKLLLIWSTILWRVSGLEFGPTRAIFGTLRKLKV